MNLQFFEYMIYLHSLVINLAVMVYGKIILKLLVKKSNLYLEGKRLHMLIALLYALDVMHLMNICTTITVLKANTKK